MKTEQLPKQCVLAANASAMVDTLFIGPRTADGYIVRKNARSVDFHAFGHDLTLNRHGVVCHRSKTPEGKTWYRFTNTNEWPLDMRETETFADSLTITRDHKGRIYR